MSLAWPEEGLLLAFIEPWLRARRWFPGTESSPVAILGAIDEGEAVGVGDLVRTLLISVEGSVLQVPVVLSEEAPADTGLLIHTLEAGGATPAAYLCDGASHPSWLHQWALHAILTPTSGIAVTREDLLAGVAGARALSGEQSNTSLLLNTGAGRMILKIYRVLSPGIHPDLEVGTALGELAWPHIAPPVAHSFVELPEGASSGAGRALATLLCPFVEGARDGFSLFVSLAAQGDDPAPLARDLGRVSAQMHLGLSEALGVGEAADGTALVNRITAEVADVATEVTALDHNLVEALRSLVAPLAELHDLPSTIRVHGDYHLGQTLYGDRWYILDFEGEPLRPVEERRTPDLPWRDVAGMLRSFDYARAQARLREGHDPGPQWVRRATSAFLEGYSEAQGGAAVPDLLLRALMVEKAAYEVRYEHRMRPDWLPIPLEALRDLAS